MPIHAERLIAARTLKGWSQDDLAARAKVSQQTIWKLETGAAKTSKFIARIASALDVDVSHLDPDYGTPEIAKVTVLPTLAGHGSTMPLFASAEGSQTSGALIVSADPIDYVSRPDILEHVKEAYSILIEGDSMTPAFEAGDMAWVNPALGPRRDHDVIIYGIDDVAGERRAMIKRLLSWTDEVWTLRQYNPPMDFKLQRDPWRICHRIVGKISKK